MAAFAVAIDAQRTPLLFHKIYIGGTILTMDTASPVAQAVVTAGNRIVYVGDKEQALQRRRWYTSVIDLQGKTMMPGFVDAHSHFLSSGLSAVLVDLNSSPAGTVDTLEQLYPKIGQAAAERKEGAWIVGFNYDNTRFPSASHPDRLSLDRVAAENPVFVRHHSGHMGVANSVALQQLLKFDQSDSALSEQQFSASSLDHNEYSAQQLMSVGKYSDNSTLNGLLQESMAPPLSRFLKSLSLREYWTVFKQARDTYASFGYTTVQEGSAGSPERMALLWLSRLGLLPMRVNVWLNADKIEHSAVTVKPLKKLFFQANTIKIIADGSPQGFTAYLSRPYLNKPDSIGLSLYGERGLSMLIEKYQRMGFRIAIHANGDAAIERVLDSVAAVHKRRQVPRAASANGVAAELTIAFPEVILVHAQTIRADQLGRLKALGISPSFFSSHSWYWGDWHRMQTLGLQRAAVISPTGSALRHQLDFSIHTDAPVTSSDPWQLLWITTERLTRSGILLGRDERIDRHSALRAMTVNAARQAGQSDQLGSIAVGKLADLIVVSDNPLLVDDVRTLQVDETVINGVSVFQRKQWQIKPDLTAAR